MLDVDRQIAQRLVRSWPAFFQRYGRLTDVQRAAVPHLLNRENLLVSSATASGKTEAACAPLAERLVQRPRGGTILYVSPTRALVNDLYARLEAPLRDMGIGLRRRTGEHKDRVSHEHSVLLTTPESFDSLLCRGGTPTGHALSNVQAVVLDEVHLLHGTPRGEQLRWLLHRLRRLQEYARKQEWDTQPHLQIVALSATVPEPQSIVSTYMSDGTILEVSGQRELEVVPPPADRDSLVEAIVGHAEQDPRDAKVLVFCNSRRRVDLVAGELKEAFSDHGEATAVFAHHGSLSKLEREDAEQALKERPRVLLVATSTLEIGVDIGDVDLVVLDGPPPSVPALLQRIGRGNRRSGTTRVMPWSNSKTESFVLEAMLYVARRGDLGITESGPHYTVLRQQVASFILQSRKRRRSIKALGKFLSELVSRSIADELIASLLDQGSLAMRDKWVVLGEQWLNKAATGAIHSTIEAPAANRVVDADTGGVIALGVRSSEGSNLGIGGHSLRVRERRDHIVEVSKQAQASPGAGDWRYVSSPWMQGAGQPQAVRAWLGVDTAEWPVLERDGWRIVFHFGGARRRAVLDLMKSEAIVNANAWFFVSRSPVASIKDELRRFIPPMEAERRIAEGLARLERLLGRPLSNAELPTDLRIREVREWLALDAERDVFAAAKLSEATEEHRLSVLRAVEGASAQGR